MKSVKLNYFILPFHRGSVGIGKFPRAATPSPAGSRRKSHENLVKNPTNPNPSPAQSANPSVWNDHSTDQASYTCDICPDRVFTDRRNYIRHLYNHKFLASRGEDRPILSREQLSESRKGKIWREIKPKFTFNCTTCDKSFWKRITYVNHMRYHAILKRKGEDRVIGVKHKSWKQRVPYQDHYTCEKCPERGFDEREAYLGHLAYHRLLERKGRCKVAIPTMTTRRREKEMKCHICDRIFTDPKAYKGHKGYHLKIRKKTGQDRPIGRKKEESCTSGGGNVLDIVAEMMEDLNRFWCACGDKFYFKDALLHHLTLATSPSCAEVEIVVKTEVVEEERPQEGENVQQDVFFCDDSSPQEDVEMKLPEDEESAPETGGDETSDDEELFSEVVQNVNNLSTSSAPVEEMEEEEECYLVPDVGSDSSGIFAHRVEEVEKDVVQIVSPGSSLFQSPEEGGDDERKDDDVEEEKNPMAAFYQCQTCHTDSDSLTGYLKTE